MGFEEPSKRKVTQASALAEKKPVLTIMRCSYFHEPFEIGTYRIRLVRPAATIRTSFQTEIVTDLNDHRSRHCLFLWAKPLVQKFADSVGIKPLGNMVDIVGIAPPAANRVATEPFIRPILQQMGRNPLHRRRWDNRCLLYTSDAADEL